MWSCLFRRPQLAWQRVTRFGWNPWNMGGEKVNLLLGSDVFSIQYYTIDVLGNTEFMHQYDLFK